MQILLATHADTKDVDENMKKREKPGVLPSAAVL